MGQPTNTNIFKTRKFEFKARELGDGKKIKWFNLLILWLLSFTVNFN